MGYQEFTIEGRNAVIEAYRAGKPIDKLFILDGCQDGPMMTIKREAKKHYTLVKYVTKERLDQLSETGKHQGVIAYAAAYEYAEVDEILEGARKKGEPPFIFLLDNIEDPHNLGAIIRTANLAGAHGVIIPKNRAAGLTATVARTSAGALNYTPVAKVTNLAKIIEELKKDGLWFVCADMGGTTMYDLNLKGPIGLVIGNEGFNRVHNNNVYRTGTNHHLCNLQCLFTIIRLRNVQIINVYADSACISRIQGMLCINKARDAAPLLHFCNHM